LQPWRDGTGGTMANILIIDDDPDAADLVGRVMRRAGHAVEVASNGRLGITRLTGTLPDMVILDMRMPEMDGAMFLEVLRSYLRWQHVPVIILTAYPEGPHIDEAARLNANEVFRKGQLNFDDLLASIERHLRKQHYPAGGWHGNDAMSPAK
jgi:CheY-like chemotaxis protein